MIFVGYHVGCGGSVWGWKFGSTERWLCHCRWLGLYDYVIVYLPEMSQRSDTVSYA
jgi:hypothetical protein